MSAAPGPRAGRPPRLSRERIVAAALEGDLESLTMRELAARLDVSHSALYRWVADREELFGLISHVMVERILPPGPPTEDTWQDWLRRLAWAMHDEFLAVPGYAAHVAAPHAHDPAAFGRLREQVVAAFAVAGVEPELAEHSWHIFGTSVVNWLGNRHQHHDTAGVEPRFDVFLDVLLRGLPAKWPATPRPCG